MCTSLWQCKRVATSLVVQVLCALETKFWSMTVSDDQNKTTTTTATTITTTYTTATTTTTLAYIYCNYVVAGCAVG